LDGRRELNYFQVFDKQCDGNSYGLIRELLIQSRDGSLIGAENYFNQFRSKIFENMNAVAAHFGIVPKGLSINDFSRFLCSKAEKYKPKEEILPKGLHMLMEYVVRMVQDGSHKCGNIQYGVHQFVSKNKDTLIIHLKSATNSDAD